MIVAGTSCSISEARNANVTPSQTSIPFIFTLPPTSQINPTPPFVAYPTSTPPPTSYPTAQTVSTNAVAFVASDYGQGGLSSSSLWIANVDGSGERKLVDNINVPKWRPYGGYARLKWSPNRKWISYLSSDELWLAAPDGSVNKKILSRDDETTGVIWEYDWSPDSKQVAFIKTSVDKNGAPVGQDAGEDFAVGILDLESGVIKMLGEYQNLFVFMKWAPNGQYLILPNRGSYVIVNTSSGKVTTIKMKAQPGYNSSIDVDLVTWSPNSQWFFQIHHGNGCAGMWSVVTTLDGMDYTVDAESIHQSVPVWDNKGNYLYLRTTDDVPCWGPTVEPNVKLQRYNLTSHQLESLLSLNGTQGDEYSWSVSISPDDRILEAYTPMVTLENEQLFVILDLDSMSVAKHAVNLGIINQKPFDNNVKWSSDNQHLVIFSEEYQPQNSMHLNHGPFYTLDIHSGKTAIISGDHRVTDWAASPAVTNP